MYHRVARRATPNYGSSPQDVRSVHGRSCLKRHDPATFDAKQLTVYTTEDLLIEMVIDDAIKRRRALHIYERVYGKGEAEFDTAIAARQAPGSAQ
jgi:hypothetical protein